MVISLIYPARFVCVTDGIVHTGQSLTYHSVFDSLEFINEPNNFRKIESPPPNTLIESSVCFDFLSFWVGVSSRGCEFSNPLLALLSDEYEGTVLLCSPHFFLLFLPLLPHHHSSPSLTLCTSKCACVACFLCVCVFTEHMAACAHVFVSLLSAARVCLCVLVYVRVGCGAEQPAGLEG